MAVLSCVCVAQPGWQKQKPGCPPERLEVTAPCLCHTVPALAARGIQRVGSVPEQRETVLAGRQLCRYWDPTWAPSWQFAKRRREGTDLSQTFLHCLHLPFWCNFELKLLHMGFFNFPRCSKNSDLGLGLAGTAVEGLELDGFAQEHRVLVPCLDQPYAGSNLLPPLSSGYEQAKMIFGWGRSPRNELFLVVGLAENDQRER